MRKLKLLLNTLSNLSLRQIYFIFFNKLIKGKLNSIYVHFFTKLTTKPIYVQFDVVKKNLSKLFGNADIWQTDISKGKKESHYYTELKHNVKVFIEDNNLNNFFNFWNIPVLDVEINYNYQRFYLFAEVFEELKVPNEKRIELIIAWIEENKNKKLGWTGFNCAIRLVNWTRIIYSCSNLSIPEKNWVRIQQSIYHQYKFNSANVEHHIPGNHVLLQYYSMWLISVVFDKWFNRENEQDLLNKLVKEFDAEYLKNGLHFELSTHYHLQITLVGLYIYDHLRSLNKPIPEILTNIVNRSVNVTHKFLLGEYYPLIGDGCYSFFHKNTAEDLSNFNYLISKLKISEAADEPVSNIDDTYLIANSKSFKIVFDVGKIGLKSNPGHGHADTLSVIIGYKNTPIFIDPGTKRYLNSSEDLIYKRTSYHTTVSVNDSDQASLWGFFRWAFIPKKINCRIIQQSNENIILQGKFEGFYELGGITHEREIEILPEEVIITDKLEGKLENFIQINFILHPEVKIVQKDGKNLIITYAGTFELKELNNLQASVNVSQLEIYESYNSPIQSKKLAFTYKIMDRSCFKSKISLKVFD